MNIDNVILELQKIGWNNLHPSIPIKDLKILKSIASCLVKPSYITESQANLIVKILKENLEYLDSQSLDISASLKNIKWSNSFRIIKKERNVDIEVGENSEIFIKVTANWDKHLNKILYQLSTKNTLGKSSKNYFTLDEKNIVLIFNHLKPLNFTFSATFLDLLEKIQSIDLEKIKNQFEFENFYLIKQNKLDTLDIFDNHLIKLDRQIRYQYKFDRSFDDDIMNSLEYKIASRPDPKIYISNYSKDLGSIIQCLEKLNRTKILLVFDMNRIEDCIYYLDKVTHYVNSNDLTHKTGIYFRFNNKDRGEEFNKLISSNNLNSNLDLTSRFVGVSTGKLPKFLLKSDWYPDAVISFTNTLRNNRTDVYCNDCDLIIYYTNLKPLISNVHEIL